MTASAWVTATEAASILNISRNAVYDRIRTGSIPAWAVAPREKGRLVQIKRSFVEADASPANVTAIPQHLSQESIQQIADAMEAVLTRMFPIARAS